MQNISARWIVLALLVFMGALMIGPAWQDSATVDEATHLAAGYTYWKGYRYRMVPNHPPLSQMIEAAPLLLMDVKISDAALAILRGQLGYPWMMRWYGELTSIQNLLPAGCEGRYVQLPPLNDQMIQWQCSSSYPLDNWYYWANSECQMFGKFLVYGGANDGDAMLFAGRLMQIALTLLTGVVIFVWARRATGKEYPALLGLALWAFNPTAIAYGHLTNTDISAAFGMTLALYLWTRFLEEPNHRWASLCGAATGVALTMKFTAAILAPIYVVTLAISWRRLNLPVARAVKLAAIAVLAMWAVILLVYCPRWTPPPAPTSADIGVLNIPSWFLNLRPLLIPSDFFKMLAMALGHSATGHTAYLMGEWSHEGWWYYFPVAFVLKSSIALVLLTFAGASAFVWKWKGTRPSEYVAWLAAGIYVASAMTSHVNIGVRHLLPMLALLCVGIAATSHRLTNRRLKRAAIFLTGWQAIVTLAAYPLYIQFFTELVGGAKNGQAYLLDSNFDWGQDARRLKEFVEKNRIGHIYLDYYGNQFSTEFLKIPNTRVTHDTARQIRQGTLVVSASELMSPDWKWLRESRQPVARVAHTLFVYQFP